MTPMNDGVRLDDRIMPAQGFTEAELDDAMYHLTADADQAELLVESCDLDMADDMLNPGESLIVEAVSAVKNRIDRTMSALVRVFNRFSNDVAPYDYPSIGPDRKNALFAYKTVTFTFDDGQTVSILFHAPGSDPKKIKPTDTLIAYRWMLNRRDITAIVSPERGRDLNLQLMAKRIMQLVEKNSDKFKANNEKRQEQKEKLETLEGEQSEANEAVDRLTQQNADLSEQVETADARIERLQSRLADMGEGDRDGSGAGADSTGTQGGGDYSKAAAAKQGLELLRDGRGHRVEGIEYSKTADGTDVTIAGTKVGTVTGRLSKSAVVDMLTNTSIDNFVDTATSLTALLNEQTSMPEGYRFEMDDDPANMKRRSKLIGWPDSYIGIKLVRPNDAVGGYSGNVSLRNGNLLTSSPAASLHLVNEATGAQDEPETIKANNITQLASLVADRVTEAFAATGDDGTGIPAGTEAGDSSQSPVEVEVGDVAGMLPVDITEVGGENVYFTKDGQRYFFKPVEADDYQVGELSAMPTSDSAGADGGDTDDTGLTGEQRSAVAGATSFYANKRKKQPGRNNATYVVVAVADDGSETEVSQDFIAGGRFADSEAKQRADAEIARLQAMQTQLQQADPAASVQESERNVTAAASDQATGNAALESAAQAMGWVQQSGGNGGPTIYGPEGGAAAVYGNADESGAMNVQVFSDFTGQKSAFADALKGALGGGNEGGSPAPGGDDGESTGDDENTDPTKDARTAATQNLRSLDEQLFRDVAHAIRTIRSIDRGDEPTMNRSAFTSSITNKLKTQVRNGSEETVDAALRLLAQQGDENGKPILAKRSGIWKATGHDMDYYVNQAKGSANAGEQPSNEGDSTGNEGDPGQQEGSEVNRISETLQGILQETDSGAAIDALEKAMDDAEAAGIDIDNDPDVAAASDHVTALLEKEAA